MSGPEGRPVEQVAAEIIAADVATTALLGRPAKTTSTVLVLPERTGPSWLLVAIGAVALLALATGAGFALGLLGGGPAPSPTAIAGPTPTATPTATPTPTPTATPAPTASPSPTSEPTPSPTPPASGQSLALGTFVRLSGACPIADTFDAAFDFVAVDGVLTLTQLSVDHITTGTVMRTGVSEATFSTAAEGQTYEGTITGNTVRGTHLYTADGCNDEYSFELMLLRPFVAPPPEGIAPGHFELLDAATFGLLLELPAGQPVHIVVASLGDPDVRALLPIHVLLHVDGMTPWDFMIEGDPTVVCRGGTGCSADAPSEVDAAWLAPDQQPVLIAMDADGNVLAVYAPNGLP